MDESTRPRSGIFRFGLPQNHLDDSKLGAILSPNSGGTSSPCTRGKTMREFEAELADLRQENFELKMKIYVLEEQKEALEDVRDFSELSKQLDKVRAELEEKEDLILKAGEAMTLMSKKHEEELSHLRSQAMEEVERYKTTISRLEQEIIELKEKSILVPRPSVFDDSSAMYAVAFNLPGARPKTAVLNCDRTSELEAKILELEELLRTKNSEVIELTTESATLKLEADRLKSVEADLTLQLEYRVQKLSEALSDLTSAEKTIQELSNRLTEAEKSRKVTPTKSNSELQILQKQYSACKIENQKLQDQVLKLHQRITELEKYNAVDLHKKIDSLMKENGDLREKILQMKHEKSKRSSCSSNTTAEEKTDNRVKDLEAEVILLKSELDNLRSDKAKTLKAMQAFMKQNRALTRDIERLEGGKPSERGDQGAESNKREELELIQGSEADEKRKESDFDTTDDPEKAYLYSALETKRQQVDQLNEKLRKRTYDLQELVNKELWSKNKEIEKLNRVCEKQVRDWTEQRTKLKIQEAEIKNLNEEIDRLRKNLSEYESSSQSSLQEKNQPAQCDHTNEFQRLKSELELQIAQNAELNSRCELLKQEAETSEKARKDLLNACCLLTTRLEELTSFLESLLPSLAGRRRRLVKEAIDMSREVSKSLSLSCLEESSIMCKSIEPILPDVSQVDFNSEEDLDDTLLPSSEAIEDQNNQVLNLRYEMENLVQRLKESSPEKKRTLKKNPLSPWSLSTSLQEQREFSPQQPFDESMFGDCIPAIALEDITEGTGIESLETDTDYIPAELINKDAKRGSSIGCAPGSESEGWSEPDRTVSMARIGLKEESVIREVGSDSSDSPAKSNNSSGKRRRESEIKSLHMKIRSLEMTIENLVSEKSKENDVSMHNVSVDCQLGEGNLTENLMSEIKNQREKLMLSLNHNDFIRQRLEEVLSSAPSSPTKSDSEKQKLYNQNLLQKVLMMTDKIDESCSTCLELKSKCLDIEKEKLSLMEMLHASEDKANGLSTELNGLKCLLKEKENDLLEKQCSLLELKNNVIILESKVKISQEEAQNQARLLEALTLESNAKARELSEKWEKERADLISHYENEIAILKMKLKELEVDLQSALSSIEKVRSEKDLMEGEYKILLDKVEREKREVVDRESQKRLEAEDRLADSLRAQRELRNQLDSELSKLAEIEASQKLSERTWRRRVAVLETSGAETEARLRRKLDQLTLSNSEAVIERTRLANERLVLQREHAHVKGELERRIHELQLANHELESRLSTITKSESAPASPRGDYKRQRSNPTSDYTSDHEHHNNWFPVCVRTNNNSSPDLGIESDNRMSSLEQPLSSPKSNGEGSTKPEKLELENSELRAQLARTRQALEETLAQLSSANQRKRQVEKAICRQLHKTHTILQKARLNLEPSDKQNL